MELSQSLPFTKVSLINAQGKIKAPRRIHSGSNTRSGAIIPLLALLMVFIIALVAFAVDYGVMLVAKLELQNAADAASVAGIETYNRDRNLADLAVQEMNTANTLFGEPITFDIGRDVEYGTWDADLRTFEVIPRNGDASSDDVSGRSIPGGANAVRVTLRRTEGLGNGIRLFFAPVIGTDFADVTAEAISSVPGRCNGFIGLDFADLRNRISTDSYDSELGSYDAFASFDTPNVNRFDSGDVCSNGPVSLASGAQVNGSAAGSSVNVAPGSGADVSGSHGTITEPYEFDPVDFSQANVNDNNTIERGPLWAPEFLTPNGDLVVNNGRNITLEAGTYVFRDLIVAGGSRLEINGAVNIFVQREVSLDNGTQANPAGKPSDFQINVGTGPVRLAGGHDLHAVIFAPQAPVTVNNNARIFGSIIGQSLTVAGNAQLHYDLSLTDDDAPLPPAGLVQ